MEPDLRAAVFDMDGTLVDNMRFHTHAWVALSKRLGLSVAPEVFEREFAGKKNDEILPILLGRPVVGKELAELAWEKETAYRDLYRPKLEAMPGLMDFLARLARSRVALAVATAAPPENRALVLDGLGLTATFAHVIGAEHAARGKPSPDIYIAAARALALPPSACVAFEDAVNGVLSARAAGMLAVGVLTTTSREALAAAGAAWIVADFREMPRELEVRLGLDG